MTKPTSRFKFSSIIGWTLSLLVIIESMALLEQILFPDYELIVLGPASLQLAVGLFWALAPFSTGLTLILILATPIRFLFDIGSHRNRLVSKLRNWLASCMAPFTRMFQEQASDRNIPLRLQIPILASILVFAVALGLTPYRQDLNPKGVLVGVDTPDYSRLVSIMLSKGPTDAVAYAFVDPIFKGSRPLALLFLYGLSAITGASSDGAVKLAPVLLAPSLAASLFVFVKYGLGDTRAAALAAVLSVCSYQVSVGIWAGYYANWLALAESYLVLTNLLRFLKSHSKIVLSSLFPLSLALLFTHPWTWTIIVALFALTTLENHIRKKSASATRLMLVLIMTNIIVDLARIFLVGSYGGEQAGFDIATRASPVDIVRVWSNAVMAFAYYDGYLMNALYLGLAVLAVLGLYRSRDDFSRVLVLWTALVALPFIFLSSILQSRIVYITPVSVLAAVGLLRLGVRLGGLRGPLLIAFVVLLGANATMQALLQLVAVPG